LASFLLSESSQPLYSDIEQTIAEAQRELGNSADLVVYQFQAFDNTKCALIYLKSFVDFDQLSRSVLSPLLAAKPLPITTKVQDLANFLPCPNIGEITQLEQVCQGVVNGEVVLLVSGLEAGLKIPLKRYKQRSITEPENEKVVRGPRDSFVESIWSNVGLIRQRIKNRNLRIELITLGTETSVELAIIYVGKLANPEIVEEVRSRLNRIDIDRLLSAGAVSEFISDSPWSPLPTVQFTERPDLFTSALLDGRIGILLDGTPAASLVPVVFWDFFKSADDYSENPLFVTTVRITRIAAHLVTLLLPGAYVALTTIHLEMLPQSLAAIVAGARTRTPFPTSVELIALEFVVEILREAGLRMPGVFGQTISIVGALVIGEAGVTAGLVEPNIVVIVAFTTLASFLVPSYNAGIAIRLLRIPLILLSASLGFYGLALGNFIYLLHLVSLRSFGVPYFAPVAPLFLKDMRDLFIRLPWWLQDRRPKVYRSQDQIRAGRNQKPGPERG